MTSLGSTPGDHVWAAIEDGRLAPPGCHLEDVMFQWMYPSYVPYSHLISNVNINNNLKANFDVNLKAMGHHGEIVDSLKMQINEIKDMHNSSSIENEMKRDKNKIRHHNGNNDNLRQVEKTDSNKKLSYSRIKEDKHFRLHLENEIIRIQDSDKSMVLVPKTISSLPFKENQIENMKEEERKKSVRVRSITYQNSSELPRSVEMQEESLGRINPSSSCAPSSLADRKSVV